MIRIVESRSDLLGKDIYNSILSRVNNGENSGDFDINSSTYGQFGTIGLTIYKKINGKWCRKHINYWRDKTLQDINEEFNNQDWEISD